MVSVSGVPSAFGRSHMTLTSEQAKTVGLCCRVFVLTVSIGHLTLERAVATDVRLMHRIAVHKARLLRRCYSQQKRRAQQPPHDRSACKQRDVDWAREGVKRSEVI